MSKQLVRLRVNGSVYEREAEPRETLADFLRVQCALTGTHLACEHGRCGACTVLLDGEDVRSCLLFAVQAEGAEITTIEGIADHDGTLAPIQRAFQQAHGLQCGFCTPGFIVTLHAYLRDNPRADLAGIRRAVAGNLCRCTGYQGIISAALMVASQQDEVRAS
jgi:aerobic carbon-monoxide dehydrogenase small subunit